MNPITIKNTPENMAAHVEGPGRGPPIWCVTLQDLDSGNTLPCCFRTQDLEVALRKAVEWSGIPLSYLDSARAWVAENTALNCDPALVLEAQVAAEQYAFDWAEDRRP